MMSNRIKLINITSHLDCSYFKQFMREYIFTGPGFLSRGSSIIKISVIILKVSYLCVFFLFMQIYILVSAPNLTGRVARSDRMINAGSLGWTENEEAHV